MIITQDIMALIDDKTTPIIIEALDSKKTVEAYVYSLSGSMYVAEKLSADNIKITVNEKAFEGIKRHIGQ